MCLGSIESSVIMKLLSYHHRLQVRQFLYNNNHNNMSMNYSHDFLRVRSSTSIYSVSRLCMGQVCHRCNNSQIGQLDEVKELPR